MLFFAQTKLVCISKKRERNHTSAESCIFSYATYQQEATRRVCGPLIFADQNGDRERRSAPPELIALCIRVEV